MSEARSREMGEGGLEWVLMTSTDYSSVYFLLCMLGSSSTRSYPEEC